MAEVEGKFAYVKRLSVGIYEAKPRGSSDANNAPRDRGDRRASFSFVAALPSGRGFSEPVF